MTNKKFKLAAMSLALTACVAASPLAANAESADAGADNPVPPAAAEVPGENTPTTNEAKPDTTNVNDPEATIENNDLAVAPAADNTVATITRQDGTTTTTTKYASFDEAVKAAESGDTIEVIKDATSTGIDLQNKNLTIKGKTVTTTTDSGTEEKTTRKPQLKFVAKDSQPKIFGITLRGSNLTFQNMDVDMTGVNTTTDNDWNAICMSGEGNAALTLNKTDLLMDGKGLPSNMQAIYMTGKDRNELNVDDHSTLTIRNYPHNAIT